MALLNHLESERHNTIRSRNARFAAIRSFSHFAAFEEPTALPEGHGIHERIVAPGQVLKFVSGRFRSMAIRPTWRLQ
jgi:hypothetical protein